MSHIKEVISERHRVTQVSYSREFQIVGETSRCGFSFPCDKDGNLMIEPDNKAAQNNFKYCISHPDEYKDFGVEANEYSYTEPAYVQCSCGEKFYLTGDTECTCGQWYNFFGQALVPPKYWNDGAAY